MMLKWIWRRRKPPKLATLLILTGSLTTGCAALESHEVIEVTWERQVVPDGRTLLCVPPEQAAELVRAIPK